MVRLKPDQPDWWRQPCHVSAARMIGLNSFPDGEDSVWVFSPEVIIALNGAVLNDEDSPAGKTIRFY